MFCRIPTNSDESRRTLARRILTNSDEFRRILTHFTDFRRISTNLDESQRISTNSGDSRADAAQFGGRFGDSRADLARDGAQIWPQVRRFGDSRANSARFGTDLPISAGFGAVRRRFSTSRSDSARFGADSAQIRRFSGRSGEARAQIRRFSGSCGALRAQIRRFSGRSCALGAHRFGDSRADLALRTLFVRDFPGISRIFGRGLGVRVKISSRFGRFPGARADLALRIGIFRDFPKISRIFSRGLGARDRLSRRFRRFPSSTTDSRDSGATLFRRGASSGSRGVRAGGLPRVGRLFARGFAREARGRATRDEAGKREVGGAVGRVERSAGSSTRRKGYLRGDGCKGLIILKYRG